ncbi:TIGR00303 family protein [Pleurocapsa sp. CCALA 161]|uniref:nicotinate mononucleotide-dependent phosphoribosyltransferase CobT n=1 Tax=Pleurocapsa sp. CCALA 161 TaxID=2107688 RepID=UPI000D04B4F2|nr:TIGR00303 family protein [Pleurocapsa sp. CCALA 161]PSB09235.1 TIGR00303 family protein [Pleurocapsa sp. CCALA 161]
MIYVYSELESGFRWLRQHHGANPSFACVLGFTATGLISGISAAGATPEDREYTAIADAEFLARGVQSSYQHPLPILTAGASPTFISRAVVEAFNIPTYIFNAGLPHSPTVDTIDLLGVAARCLSSGQAMPLQKVQHLFNQGLNWGNRLADTGDYLIIGECVVGGTTTALALLTALGIEAQGMVNSSHPCCNHQQKWSVVETGLSKLDLTQFNDPLALVAAVGDPMQIVVAGMAISASRRIGVMLAGGTQMLAVSALIKAIANYHQLSLQLPNIVVGTTRWVTEDPTGNTVGLAKLVSGVPLLATDLSFATSRYPSLRAYTQGYVKEGVGAGGCAIATHLKQNWTSTQLLNIIESLFARYRRLRMNSVG